MYFLIACRILAQIWSRLLMLNSWLTYTLSKLAVLSHAGGAVDLSSYATGERLQRLGLIDGHDMTLEACVTKLTFLMGKGLKGPELKTAMVFLIVTIITYTSIFLFVGTNFKYFLCNRLIAQETNLRGELTSRSQLQKFYQPSQGLLSRLELWTAQVDTK